MAILDEKMNILQRC